jgi:hypothetical protein
MKNPISPDIRILRNFFLVSAVFLIFVACNEITKPKDQINGVWETTHVYVLANGDTVYSSDTDVIHKIYLDGYVMWTANPASDSSEWYGYGTYKLKNDTIIENLLSMSLPMKAQTDSKGEFIIKFNYDENNFKQEIRSKSNDTVYQQIEVYKRLNK